MAKIDVQQLAALLTWYEEVGVDEAIDLAPADRTAAPAPAAMPAVRPAAEARHEAPPRSAGRPADRPADRPAAAPLPPTDLAAGADARSLAEQCLTLAELENALAGFEGCPLKVTATQMVFADGNPEADLMIMGEAPGGDEDRIGRPFVGRAGQLLDRMLAAIGRDRTSTYISNVVVWRPPGNRKPSNTEIAVMLPFAERHITLARPKVLVLAGGTAAAAILGTSQGITRLRGRWVDHQVPGLAAPVPVMPIFHPAYLLRQPAHKRFAWRDLIEVAKRLEA